MGTAGTIGRVNDSAEEGTAGRFEDIVQAYRPRIFRFALASLRDRDDAETITQDCFLRAHRAWDQFRSESSIQTWLMQIAVNLIRDLARSRRLQFWKQARRTAVDLDIATARIADLRASPEECASARQQVAAVWNVVAELSERQRTVFLLHFLEGMEAAEIEAATGISRAAIKVHLFRAVHRVRQRLGELQ
jgi:RNA polymerase sigma-70 factor (ECF subfamily)